MLSVLRVLDISLSITCLLLLRRLVIGKRRGPLPPGPPGLPLVGNAFDMPRSYEWLTFSKWVERWGKAISSRLIIQALTVIQEVLFT